MAFQARICVRCCHRLLVSDVELAWRYGLDSPSAPFIVRYIGHTRVRFFMRQHLRCRRGDALSTEQMQSYARRWPGVGALHVRALLDRMG